MKKFAILAFQGLNQSLLPGENPRQTRSLDGVTVRFGKIIGSGGITELESITTEAGAAILRLMAYSGTSNAVTILRMLPAAVHKLNTSTDAWDDVTGTALNGTTTIQPQWTMHKGVLTFVNEGKDRPRKWTGSGNTAVLGGTPPYAKSIANYMTFLFLGNVSTDGVTFVPRRINYSEDYDVDWTDCSGSEINLDETSGDIRAMLALGHELIVYKADAVQPIRYIGGKVRFKQDVFPFDQGILAPLSLQMIGNAAHVFLATDLQLYTLSNNGIKAVPPFVVDKLQSTMDVTYADHCVSAVTADNDAYHLFYRTSASDSHKRARISFNFRTGEFYHRTYAGHQFTDALGFKFSDNAAQKFIASASTLVYELETTDSQDKTTAVSRYYDTDWQTFQSLNPKVIRRINLLFKRTPNVRVKVSIAYDYLETFFYEQTYDLKGNAGEDTATIEFIPPQERKATAFNIRIRFFHDSTNKAELRGIFFDYDEVPGELTWREGNQATGKS